jgi:hypothetical protein
MKNNEKRYFYFGFLEQFQGLAPGHAVPDPPSHSRTVGFLDDPLHDIIDIDNGRPEGWSYLGCRVAEGVERRHVKRTAPDHAHIGLDCDKIGWSKGDDESVCHFFGELNIYLLHNAPVVMVGAGE